MVDRQALSITVIHEKPVRRENPYALTKMLLAKGRTQSIIIYQQIRKPGYDRLRLPIGTSDIHIGIIGFQQPPYKGMTGLARYYARLYTILFKSQRYTRLA